MMQFYTLNFAIPKGKGNITLVNIKIDQSSEYTAICSFYMTSIVAPPKWP